MKYKRKENSFIKFTKSDGSTFTIEEENLIDDYVCDGYERGNLESITEKIERLGDVVRAIWLSHHETEQKAIADKLGYEVYNG